MTARPRVVFLDHVARLSGGEIALLRLLPALREYVDVHVILGEDGVLAERLAELGIPVEVLPLDPRLRDLRRQRVPLGSIGVAVAFVRYVVRLRRRMRRLDAQIVHTNSLKAAMYGGVAGRLARIPVIWHVRDRIAADYLPRTAVVLVRAAARLLPSAIVANSYTTLATIGRTVGPSAVAYNPVVQDVVSGPIELDSHARRAQRPFTVGILGRLAPWKGQDLFLDAFATAFRGTGVRGSIVGSALFGEDDYAERLGQRVAALEIADQVDFAGFREDVWAVLAELDVLVHASLVPEPFGQVVLEGMAAGLAVVASNEGGPAEIITDGVNGLLFAPRDPDALAAALVRLEADPELRVRLGTAARERATDFRPEKTAARLVGIYSAVLDARR